MLKLDNVSEPKLLSVHLEVFEDVSIMHEDWELGWYGEVTVTHYLLACVDHLKYEWNMT